MNVFKKIKWKRGMEITPDTFYTLDRYHESLVEAALRLSVAHGYGIIPDRTPMTQKDSLISTEERLVKINSLKAISQSGKLFYIENECYEIPYSDNRDGDCYMVLQHREPMEDIRSGATFLIPKYSCAFLTLSEIGVDDFPIAKMYQGRIQKQYIPPCMSLDALSKLLCVKDECQEQVNNIVQILEQRYPSCDIFYLRMLVTEMNSIGGTESPQSFCLLLTKIADALSYMKIEGFDNPKHPQFPAFNNNDMLISINCVRDYFSQYKENLENNTPSIEPKEEKAEEVDWIEI